MPIKVTCPSCGKALKVADEAAGKRGRCPHCQNSVTVPLLSQPPETEEKTEPGEGEDLKLVKEEILDDVRRCPGCGIIVDKSARVCTHCGTDLLTGQKFIKAATLARPTPEKAKVPPATFWAALPYAPTYPFNPKGLVTLLVGAVLLYISIMTIFQVIVSLVHLRIFFLSLGLVARVIIGTFTAGYLGSYLFKIIGETGRGEDEPPSWPDLTAFVDDILVPLGHLFAAILVSFGPFFVYRGVCAFKGIPTQNVIYWLLIIYGIVYLPMTIVAVSGFQSLAALNPLLVIPSILKVPLQYFGAVVFLGLIYVPRFLSGRIGIPQVPILSPLLSQFVSFYFLMLEMRILGLLYRYNKEKLNWF